METQQMHPVKISFSKRDPVTVSLARSHSKSWRRLLCILLLGLSLLPIRTLAMEENTVVALPTAVPTVSFAPVQEDLYSITQMENYYGHEGTDGGMYQYPDLTPNEKAKLPQLLEAYAAQERASQSVLDPTTDVEVGVYSLPRDQYEGEAVYVLLPVRELTQDELLAIIAAYDELGLPFTADSLSYRSCMRGGGANANRPMAAEEWDRYQLLLNLYKRQGLRPEGTGLPIPSESGCGLVKLHEDSFCGLDEFQLLPSRSLTDEELLVIIRTQYGEDFNVDASAFLQYEIQTRKEMTRLFSAPPSMEMHGEDWVLPANTYDVNAGDYQVYSSQFSAPLNGKTLTLQTMLNVDTQRMDTAYWSWSSSKNINTDIQGDPMDEKWLTLARSAVEAMRKDGVQIQSIGPTGERRLSNNHGFGVSLDVIMADGSCYDLTFSYVDDTLVSMVYHANGPAIYEPHIYDYDVDG